MQNPAILRIQNGRLQRMNGKPINQKTFAGGLIGAVVVTGGIAAAGTAARASGNNNQMQPLPTQAGQQEKKSTVANLEFDILQSPNDNHYRLDLIGCLDVFNKLQTNGKGTKDTLQMYGIDNGGNGKTTAMNIAAGMDGVCVVQIDPNDWWLAVKNSKNLKKDYKQLGLRVLQQYQNGNKPPEHIIFFIDEINDSNDADKALFTKNSTAMKALPQLKNNDGKKVMPHIATFGNLRNQEQADAQFNGFVYKDYPDGQFAHPNEKNGDAFARRLIKIDGFDGKKNLLEFMASYLIFKWVDGYNKRRQLYSIKFDSEHLSAIADVIKSEKLGAVCGNAKNMTVGDWVNGGEMALWDYMQLVQPDSTKVTFKMFANDYFRKWLRFMKQKMESADDEEKKMLRTILYTMDYMADQINNNTMTMLSLRHKFTTNQKTNKQRGLGLRIPPWLKNYLEWEVSKQSNGQYMLQFGNNKKAPQKVLKDMENFVKKLGVSKVSTKKSHTVPNLMESKRKKFDKGKPKTYQMIGRNNENFQSKVIKRGNRRLPMKKSTGRNGSYTSMEKNRKNKTKFNKTLDSNVFNL
jgi:hypothetical protein